jgi:hypothetical protein
LEIGHDDGTIQSISGFLSVFSAFRDLPMVEDNAKERFNEACGTRIGKSVVRSFHVQTEIRYSFNRSEQYFGVHVFVPLDTDSFAHLPSLFVFRRLVEPV